PTPTPTPTPSPTSIKIAPLGSPRILVSDATSLTRLRSLLTNRVSSATRFKSYVDSQLAGFDNYGFEAWHAALMTQVTGDTSYCKFAVNLTDNFVTDEELL